MLTQIWMSVNGMNTTANPVRIASIQRAHSLASARMDTAKWEQSALVKSSYTFKVA